MISLNHLTKRFGSQTAVDAISFDIPVGQIVGFLGPNGAGKSTTLKMLTGMIAPTSGTATVCMPIYALLPRLRGIVPLSQPTDEAQSTRRGMSLVDHIVLLGMLASST